MEITGARVVHEDSNGNICSRTIVADTINTGMDGSLVLGRRYKEKEGVEIIHLFAPGQWMEVGLV